MKDFQIVQAALMLLPLLRDLLGDRAADVERRLSHWLEAERKGTQGAASEILQILIEHRETRQWLEAHFQENIKAFKSQPTRSAPAVAASMPVLNAPRKYEVVRIFFATDRRATGAAEPRRAFDGERSEDGMHYGTCQVSIPATHVKGKLERPPSFLRSFWEDPAKHVLLQRLDISRKQDLFAGLRTAGKEALLFIHGYNVSFEDGARRTAQLAWDLKFDGSPVLYSWPSKASTAKYPADEASVEWTAEHLKTFLSDLASEGGLSGVHVIAHSMGNRALTAALRLLALEGASSKHIHEVILTAPDLDSGVFRQIGAYLVKASRRVTLYASQDDLALQASKKFHSSPRAGDPEDGIIILPGIDSIDATGADTSLLAHSYFGSVRSILSDMFYALSGLPAEKRSELRAVVSPEGTYFRYSA